MMLCYGEQSMTSVQNKCVICKSMQSEIQIKTQRINKRSEKFDHLNRRLLVTCWLFRLPQKDKPPSSCLELEDICLRR